MNATHADPSSDPGTNHCHDPHADPHGEPRPKPSCPLKAPSIPSGSSRMLPTHRGTFRCSPGADGET
eukprot:15432266-Alexandrium_andersonii.AAC.1